MNPILMLELWLFPSIKPWLRKILTRSHILNTLSRFNSMAISGQFHANTRLSVSFIRVLILCSQALNSPNPLLQFLVLSITSLISPIRRDPLLLRKEERHCSSIWRILPRLILLEIVNLSRNSWKLTESSMLISSKIRMWSSLPPPSTHTEMSANWLSAIYLLREIITTNKSNNITTLNKKSNKIMAILTTERSTQTLTLPTALSKPRIISPKKIWALRLIRDSSLRALNHSWRIGRSKDPTVLLPLNLVTRAMERRTRIQDLRASLSIKSSWNKEMRRSTWINLRILR